MLRHVALPNDVTGALFLSAMPGRYEPLGETLAQAQDQGVTRIVCLAPWDEVARRAPHYARAITSNVLPWPVVGLPLPDYGVPADVGAFATFLTDAAAWLRSGERLLLHCGAGIGRTGTVAACLLIALGAAAEEALAAVEVAGSHPETPAQRQLVQWVAQRASKV